jgi:uncharacterized protein YabE (DUF348 family)
MISKKKMMFLFCILIMAGFGMEGVQAATGKCVVVKVDGGRMVIECNKQTKGFTTGNQIKIKTDKNSDTRDK